MVQNALRMVLAAMLAICSPAWCCCAFAQPRQATQVNHPERAEVADDCCAPSASDECTAVQNMGDRTPHAVAAATPADHDPCPGRDQCDHACCDAVVTATRSLTPGTSLDLHAAPLPQVMVQIEAVPVDLDPGSGAQGWGAGSDGNIGRRAENSLLAQRCLFLI